MFPFDTKETEEPMKKTTKRIVLESTSTETRTLTAGNQNVTLSITGQNVAVTGGTPEARALVSEVLSIVNPSPAPAGVAKPTRTKTSGRGSGQAGMKRGTYNTKKRLAEQTVEQTETPAPDTAQTETPAE
jgi:hypothetical protein